MNVLIRKFGCFGTKPISPSFLLGPVSIHSVFHALSSTDLAWHRTAGHSDHCYGVCTPDHSCECEDTLSIKSSSYICKCMHTDVISTHTHTHAHWPKQGLRNTGTASGELQRAVVPSRRAAQLTPARLNRTREPKFHRMQRLPVQTSIHLESCVPQS